MLRYSNQQKSEREKEFVFKKDRGKDSMYEHLYLLICVKEGEIEGGYVGLNGCSW